MAVNRGTPRGEIVHLFGVPLTTIGRYVKQRRETGAVDLKTAPGRTSGASSFNKMLKRRANVSVPGNLHGEIGARGYRYANSTSEAFLAFAKSPRRRVF